MKKLIIAATALAAGTAVLAQTAPVAPPVPSAPVRPVQDNVMTRAEAVTLVRNHFSRIDADRNGSIGTSEIEQTRTKLREGRKARRLERRLERDPNAAFDRIDIDKNGAISREEFTQAREERIEKRIVMREKRAELAKDGKHAMRPDDPRGFGDRMIVMADGNQDGYITLVEAETMALQHFDRMDSNRDGQVTREERRAGRRKVRHAIEEKSDS